MLEILFMFMLFSVVGWLWETPWVSFNEKKFVNRGFLHGPYIPIYGMAVVTIILSMGIFYGANQSNPLIIIVQIVYMAVVTAVWEFGVHYLLEKIFHMRWWDYSRHKYNLQGRICLHVSIFFGIGGYILWRFVLPPFEMMYHSLSVNEITLILVGFYTVFMIDSYFTLKGLFQLRHIIDVMKEVTQQLESKIEQRYDSMVEIIRTKTPNIRSQFEEWRNEYNEYVNSIESKLPQRLTEELNKAVDSYTSSRVVTRFYRKYPNCRSYKLSFVNQKFKTIKTLLKSDTK